MLDLLIVRAIFILVLATSAYLLHPFGLPREIAAVGGLILGGGIIFFEIRLERVSLKRLIGAAFGSVLGIFGAFLMSLVLTRAGAPPFLQVCLLLLMTYVGLIVGAKKGDMLNLAALGGIF
ncbi:MAG: PIN domain nuclease, partial [Bryobacteraceae bacterium]